MNICRSLSLLAAAWFVTTLPPQTTTQDSTSGQTVDAKSSSKRDESPNRFSPINLFDLETATEPQISPDGSKAGFVRNYQDILKDRKRSNLWVVNSAGSDLRPLTSGNGNDHSPRWSPDGKRLKYVA